ncbi:hypothetical protein HY17_05555 [Hyphomonas sp. CY54-11-8]|jgi:hypothetical protein|nr:hypothetical protein HY17_05555 [Hyphomonas sp. CY54-11-8]
MNGLTTELDDRREEFDTHHLLAHALEARLVEGEPLSLGSVALSARHVSTLKSGLIVHLYNVEEAIMSRIVRQFGEAIRSSTPRTWTENTLREWLRASALITTEGSEDTRLQAAHRTFAALVFEQGLEPKDPKKPSGTWSDKLIYRFAERLGVDLNYPPELYRQLQPEPHWGDQSPLEFLAERRNALAHGRQSFETGARNLTLERIRELADVTFEFLSHTIIGFETHLNGNLHLRPVDVA